MFTDEARERMRSLADTEAFNTQLSMVSIVGGRGVGKSTIASLLSGNSSMFTVGSGSVGTTTTGFGFTFQRNCKTAVNDYLLHCL